MGTVGHHGKLESSYSPQRRGATFPPHGRPVLVESVPGMSRGFWVLPEWDGNVLGVVPFQFEPVTVSRLGNGRRDLGCDRFPDEGEGALIGCYRVHGEGPSGIGQEDGADPRNDQNRFGGGEGNLLEPVESVADDVDPQR